MSTLSIAALLRINQLPVSSRNNKKKRPYLEPVFSMSVLCYAKNTEESVDKGSLWCIKTKFLPINLSKSYTLDLKNNTCPCPGYENTPSEQQKQTKKTVHSKRHSTKSTVHAKMLVFLVENSLFGFPQILFPRRYCL